MTLLEDADGDGFFDKSTMFADKMTFPQGGLWHQGALYVCSPPGLWRLEDTNGDGKADKRDQIATGFAYTGNAAAWAPIAYDPESGFVYVPTEAATGDYYGGHRHGNNLFSTSLVALDSRTGERVWHFQTIHHDIWDCDNPSAPILADLPNGNKVIMQVTKQSYVYTFDR